MGTGKEIEGRRGMKVERNIATTRDGGFQIRITRSYQHRRHFSARTIEQARRIRDEAEKRWPIKSPFYHPKKAKA